MRSVLPGPAHQLAVRMCINNCTHGHNSHAPCASNCACAEGLHFSAFDYYSVCFYELHCRYRDHYIHPHHYNIILVKLPCEYITGNIGRGCGREPIKHEAQPSALFARNHAPSAIFFVMHERERYFNWFIVAAFLASAALNDSKWALRSKLPSNDAPKEPWKDR